MPRRPLTPPKKPAPRKRAGGGVGGATAAKSAKVSKSKRVSETRRPRARPTRPRGSERGLRGPTSAPKPTHSWSDIVPAARKKYKAEQKAAQVLVDQAQALKEWKEKERVWKKEKRAKEKARTAKKAAKRAEILQQKLKLGKERLLERLKPKKKSGPSGKARKRESYADRIARLMGEGYSRSEARGHPRKKYGELGKKFGKIVDDAGRAAKGDAEREVVRRMILERAGIQHFEAEREFHGRSYVEGGVKGPRAWHERRKQFEAIAAVLERQFGTSQNQTFNLLFSP